MSLPTITTPVPRKDITIKQNSAFSLGLLIIERDETGNAVVVDTAGWEAVLQVRPEPGTASPVILTASTLNGRIVTGIQDAGSDQVNIDIKIPKSDTAGITWFGCAGYDLLVIYPDGEHDYLMEGDAILQPAYSWKGTA